MKQIKVYCSAGACNSLCGHRELKLYPGVLSMKDIVSGECHGRPMGWRMCDGFYWFDLTKTSVMAVRWILELSGKS